MEIGSAKPIPILPESREVPRINASGAVPVAQTALAIGQTVQHLNAGSGVGGDQRRAPVLLSDTVDRHFEIDPATQQVVYQAVDKQTGDVVRQFPDRAILRLRAYAHELRQAAVRNSAGAAVSEVA